MGCRDVSQRHGLPNTDFPARQMRQAMLSVPADFQATEWQRLGSIDWHGSYLCLHAALTPPPVERRGVAAAEHKQLDSHMLRSPTPPLPMHSACRPRQQRSVASAWSAPPGTGCAQPGRSRVTARVQARLAAAVHRAVHRRDGREVDDLHVAAEVAVAHDLARRVRVHADDAAVAQVEHVAAVQLRARAAARRQAAFPRPWRRGSRSDVSRGLGSEAGMTHASTRNEMSHA